MTVITAILPTTTNSVHITIRTSNYLFSSKVLFWVTVAYGESLNSFSSSIESRIYSFLYPFGQNLSLWGINYVLKVLNRAMKSYGTGERRHDIGKAKLHEVSKHRWRWIELEYTSSYQTEQKNAKDLRDRRRKEILRWLIRSFWYIPLHRF